MLAIEASEEMQSLYPNDCINNSVAESVTQDCLNGDCRFIGFNGIKSA